MSIKNNNKFTHFEEVIAFHYDAKNMKLIHALCHTRRVSLCYINRYVQRALDIWQLQWSLVLESLCPVLRLQV